MKKGNQLYLELQSANETDPSKKAKILAMQANIKGYQRLAESENLL